MLPSADQLVPENYVPSTTDLNSVALEIAQGWYSDEQIRQAHNLSLAQWSALQSDTDFTLLVSRYHTELLKTGEQFKIDAKISAQQHLRTVQDIIKDPATPASVRMDAIKWLARMAELEPKEATGKGTGMTQINICWAGGEQLTPGAGITIDVNGN